MNQSFEHLHLRFPWYLRLTLSSVGLVLIGLLVTAGLLTPSPKGYGTHQQLNLPPCSFLQISGGKPCPTCGMTTSWSHFVRLQIWRSVTANAGGTMLAGVAVLAGPWLLLSGLMGRWCYGIPSERLVIITLLAILAVTLVTWLIRIL